MATATYTAKSSINRMGNTPPSLTGRMAMGMDRRRGKKFESVMKSTKGIIHNLATSKLQHVLIL